MYLHRLLTLRVVPPEGEHDVNEQLLVDAYAEYGTMPTLFQYTADGKGGLPELDAAQTRAAAATRHARARRPWAQ